MTIMTYHFIVLGSCIFLEITRCTTIVVQKVRRNTCLITLHLCTLFFIVFHAYPSARDCVRLYMPRCIYSSACVLKIVRTRIWVGNREYGCGMVSIQETYSPTECKPIPGAHVQIAQTIIQLLFTVEGDEPAAESAAF